MVNNCCNRYQTIIIEIFYSKQQQVLSTKASTIGVLESQKLFKPLATNKIKTRGKTLLNLVLLNFHSLNNKNFQFKTYLINDKINIFLGKETHLDSTTTDNMIENYYNIYRLDRNKFGGGVTIGIKNYLKSKSINDILTDSFESAFAELYFKNSKYIIGSIYIAPNPTLTQINEFERPN
jgi:hypothetical protein